jgi:hypothetical protein
MLPFFKKPSNRHIGGYVKFFGLEKWYLSLTPQQLNLLRQARSDLTSNDVSYTSETAGHFLSACAAEVARYDVGFAEQLYHKALELEFNPVHRHYILMQMADFHKELSNSIKWFKTIQDDLALLPTFVKTWSKQERSALPAYPAIEAMLRILQSRGDLPEALSLCQQARKLRVAGDWDRQIDELQLKMQD